MKIDGTLEEIKYRNEENGYTVAVIDFKGTPVTAVGKLMQAEIGSLLALEGQFVQNQKYGYQFAFTSFEISMPKTKLGILKFLASGLIKGIGAVTAKNIVNMFGDKTLEIMEFTPEKLSSVKGISAKKANEIGLRFSEVKKLQNAIIFLQSYNITTNLALRIIDAYGDKTIEVVKTNPYKLVEDVDGVGFLTADKIAKSIGIPETSEFRLRAGMLYTIKQASDKNGNTFIYKDELMTQTSKFLELSLENLSREFTTAFDSLCLDKTCTTMFYKGHEIVMLTKYYFYEQTIAEKLYLLTHSTEKKEENFDTEIAFFEDRNKITFHEEQKNAINAAIREGVSVITGGPGTGKTTIIKCIIDILSDMQKNILLLAPTGRASKRLSDSTGREAKTIHRALEVNTLSNGTSKFVHNENNLLRTNCVIVDEVSMVDVLLMSSLLKALPRDCKLILVGDKDQLPSVGAGNVLADIINSNLVSVSSLTKIFRQSDNSLIVTNAHLINSGKMPIIDNSSNDFFFEEHEEVSTTSKAIINLVTTRLPNFCNCTAQSVQVLAPMRNGLCGIDNLNQTLQERINPPSPHKKEIAVGQTIFRLGDKVMQTVNNYDLTWVRQNGLVEEEGEGVFNGDIGYIVNIDKQTLEVDVEFEDKRICTYPRTDVGNLSLAYAITIHKSQGSEFDIAVIPCIAGPSLILTRNLIYTAVTRAKKMVVLVGQKANLKRMIANKYTVTRLTLLCELIKKCKENADKLFN